MLIFSGWLDYKLLIVLGFFFNILIYKLVILNILRKIKKENKEIYEKFGKPTLAFSDYGRDEIVAWKVMKTDLSKYSKLRILKVILGISLFFF